MRAHCDHLISEYQSKTEEAASKISKFDRLQASYEQCSSERDAQLGLIQMLEAKLQNNAFQLDSIEEARKGDQYELVKMREQLSIFQKEYSFYKDLADRQQNNSAQDQMAKRLVEVQEAEKDLVARLASLQEENMQLGTMNRQYQIEQQRMQKDLKQIMAINSEFQQQAMAFRDKENQFVELGREYKEKLELLKFERERIALKEEQFMRIVHKAETEAKNETRKNAVRFENQLIGARRDADRRVEDLEDKLNQCQDENEELRNKQERMERQLASQLQQLASQQRMQDSLSQQYQKLMEGLKQDCRDAQRSSEMSEMRLLQQRQELNQKTHEAELKCDFAQQTL